MNICHKTVLAAVAAAALAGAHLAPAHATVLDVDLTGTSTANQDYGDVGTLGIGTNTITGENKLLKCGTVPGMGASCSDSFSVILPAGDEITFAEWVFGTSVVEGTEPVDDETDNTVSETTYILSNVPFTDAGLLAVDVEIANTESCNTATPPECTYYDGQFELEYTVAAIPTTTVPEPASLALFGASLVLLGVLKRRQSRSRA